MRYSDCYPGCGGEDCPCCEIFVDHQYEMQHPRDPRDMDDYDIYGNSRVTTMNKSYPCDGPEGGCPYDAQYSEDCRYYCGLGVDEDSPPDEEEMLSE